MPSSKLGTSEVILLGDSRGKTQYILNVRLFREPLNKGMRHPLLMDGYPHIAVHTATFSHRPWVWSISRNLVENCRDDFFQFTEHTFLFNGCLQAPVIPRHVWHVSCTVSYLSNRLPWRNSMELIRCRSLVCIPMIWEVRHTGNISMQTIRLNIDRCPPDNVSTRCSLTATCVTGNSLSAF